MESDIATVKHTLPVSGMTCASCVNTVQTALAKQPGVVQASVNLANNMATVEFVPNITDDQKLKQAVQAAGYDLVLQTNDKTPEVGLEEVQQQRLHSIKVNTIWSGVLSVPLVVIAMFFMDIPLANYIMWALATPVVLWLGRGFFINAVKQLKHKSANMDTLVALSTGIAYVYSVYNTLFTAKAHVYFEAAAVVVFFILVGKWLEERAKAGTSSAIKKLMGLQPKTVSLVYAGGFTVAIPIEEVKVNDVLQAKPGERIAVDGIVVNGSSYVDESMINGEPVAVLKEAQAKVFAGTINQKGSFQYKAQKVGSDTLLAQIIKAVQEAQGSKAPVQKLADKIAGVFVPVVLGISIITFLCWVLIGGRGEMAHAVISMVTVLVIACPCALGLATPTAIMVGMGKGANMGILIKNAEALETAKKITTVVLDKTGTITEGKPTITALTFIDEQNVNVPLLKSILLALEMPSEHPLAEPIVNYLKGEHIQPATVTDFQSITGKGVTALYGGKRYIAGNTALLDSYNITIRADITTQINTLQQQAATVILFADDANVLAIIALTDKIKSNSIQAIAQLKDMGIEVYMLTGDNATAAQAIATEAGLGTNYKAGVLAQDKGAFIKNLQQHGKTVAMVGDGINDSNALAQADVSIAMGQGSDIAMDIAMITIVSSDLTKIPQAIKLSKQTVNTLRQNLFWAFIYNLIGIPIAAGALYAVNGFLLNPMIAGAAMALSSVSVVSNSLLLKIKRI